MDKTENTREKLGTVAKRVKIGFEDNVRHEVPVVLVWPCFRIGARRKVNLVVPFPESMPKNKSLKNIHWFPGN